MMDSKNNNILRVYQTEAQAKRNYDKISRFYDCFARGFESNYRNMALEQSNIKGGETVLEICIGQSLLKQ